MDRRQNSGFEGLWLCSGTLRRRLLPWQFSLLAAMSALLRRLFPGRMHCEVWIRYRRELGGAEEATVPLSPMSPEWIRTLSEHPLQGRDQMRSAVRLWQHGLRNAFLWVEGGEPLCMQWLFLPSDSERLLRLPDWSDLYLALPEDAGHAENIFTFPRGLRRRGGAATEFAQAVFAHARRLGLNRLYTHASERNLGARRWAERTGWEAYGTIRRYRLDLPLLRRRAWCLHGVERVLPLPRTAPRPMNPDCRLEARLSGLMGR